MACSSTKELRKSQKSTRHTISLRDGLGALGGEAGEASTVSWGRP